MCARGAGARVRLVATLENGQALYRLPESRPEKLG